MHNYITVIESKIKLVKFRSQRRYTYYKYNNVQKYEKTYLQ